MKTVEETRRELFEAWYSSRSGYKPERSITGNYTSIGPALAWQGFNAALDAVEIELPAKWDAVMDGRGRGMYAEDEARDSAIDDCRAAIESTNLGIKVK